jgi:mono/diheme cytochrome c family protein
MNRVCAVLLTLAFAAAAVPSGAQFPAASVQIIPSATATPGPSAASPAPAQDASASAFVARCSGCHTVGGGKLQGPDLLPATQWTDAQLRPAIKLMEKNVGPLSNDDLDGLVALLRDPAVRDRITTSQRSSMQKMESTLDRPSPTVGAALFHGPRALANGGLPCATCHQVAGEGGSLGPDLTAVASKLSGPPLISAVRNASFNVMRAAYRDHPITQQEAMHLAAWFESLKGTPASASATQIPALGIAFGGLAFLAIVISLRPRGGVRARLLRRSLSK